jgi:hypothetical protein
MSDPPERIMLHTRAIEGRLRSLGDRALRVEFVVALEKPGHDTLVLRMSHYAELAMQSDEANQHEVELPAPIGQRVYDFYDQTMTKADSYHAEVAPFNCSTFTRYLSGLEDTLNVPFEPSHLGYYGVEVAPRSLSAGQPYIASRTKGKRPKHTMLGLGESFPSDNISVFGSGKPLVLTDTASSMAAWGADQLHELIYK